MCRTSRPDGAAASGRRAIDALPLGSYEDFSDYSEPRRSEAFIVATALS